MAGRWILVSNRLPLTYKGNKLQKGSGGLVTAITGIQTNTPILWVGSASGDIPQKEYLQALGKLKDKMSYHPIFLKPDQYDQYYNGICNDVLWPLLHYETAYVRFNSSNWQIYREVNEIFAKELAELARDDDVIWLHDFHLFLVAKRLKELRPKIKIGFFLHIPFPSSEIFRQLPVAKEILDSLTHADLVGFHDYSYLRHFVSSIKNILGIDSSHLYIERGEHTTKLGVFPASIDSLRFRKLTQSVKTKAVLKSLSEQKSPPQIILGIDRLDYIKGIDLKLRAFRLLLRKYPELVGKVQLIQVAVPSRTNVPEYIQLKEEIDKLVGEINGEFGTHSYVPIKYIFSSIPPYELSALYSKANVLLITSKRDGMNLVALEYIVSQNLRRPGMLVLSEFTGAFSNLSSPLSINPWDLDKTAQTIYEALRMPVLERKQRIREMSDYLSRYTATVWAKAFIQELISYQPQTAKAIDINLKDKVKIRTLLERAKSAEKVNIFLDFDGTLCPIVSNPADAQIHPSMLSLLEKLNKNPKTNVCVVSGREKKFLKRQFSHSIPCMASEHGASFYDPKTKRWKNLISDPKRKWYAMAKKIMEDFTKRVPGSLLEQKDYGLSWHYRNSPEAYGEFQARKLKLELEDLLTQFPVTVMGGKKIIEVKDIAANKGAFTRWFLGQYEDGDSFSIALGDDETDEDIFRELIDDSSLTVKVGDGFTHAKFRLSGQQQVEGFLRILVGQL